jgi:hypothetical protein
MLDVWNAESCHSAQIISMPDKVRVTEPRKAAVAAFLFSIFSD